MNTVGMVTTSSQYPVTKGLKSSPVYSSSSAYHDCSGDLLRLCCCSNGLFNVQSPPISPGRKMSSLNLHAKEHVPTCNNTACTCTYVHVGLQCSVHDHIHIWYLKNKKSNIMSGYKCAITCITCTLFLKPATIMYQ